MKTNLMSVRKSAGFKSREDIAKALGVNVYTYTYWETGRTDISASTLCLLADFFEVSVDYLLGRETANYKDPRESELHLNYRSVSEERKNILVQVSRDASAAEGLAQLVAQGNATLQGSGNTVSTGDVAGNENVVGSNDSGNVSDPNNVTNITNNFGAAEDGVGTLGT